MSIKNSQEYSKNKLLNISISQDNIKVNAKKDFDSENKRFPKKILRKKIDLKSSNELNQIEPNTTERLTNEALKESSIDGNNNNKKRNNIDMNSDTDSQNISYDLRTSYGDEGIEFGIKYNIIIKNSSSLQYIYNKKNDSNNLNIGPKMDQQNDTFPQVSEKKNSSLRERPLNEDINNKEKNNLNHNVFSFFTFDNSFNSDYMEIFEEEYKLYEKNNIFQTKIIYEKKESNLLLYKEYLYILEIKPLKNEAKPKNNEYNPDLSLINKIRNNKFGIDITEKNNIKNIYELSHPLLCLNFNLLSCKLLLNKKNSELKNNNNNYYEIKILILGSSKKISFFVNNYENYQKISYLLGNKIYNYEGYKINRIGLSLRKDKFYRDTFISFRDFDTIVNTGDLLLFRTIGSISNCQRLFTCDQYDHSAIIIKRHGMAEILECTSNEKCNLLQWSQFKYKLYNLFFNKIVLRSLNIEEDDPIILNEIKKRIEKKSLEFIEKVNKKDYYLSFLKMVFKPKPEQYEINGKWENSEGFCCSALNSAFYSYIGVIKLEKSVHCMKPGDFEQDKNRLTILPGFSFGPEKVIDFSDDFCGVK